MELHFRPPTVGDYRAMGELHAACFPALPMSAAERARLIPEHVLVHPGERALAFHGEVLFGMYGLLRFELWLGGCPVPAGGLAGVAVAPEARGQGVARKLVEHALASCRAEARPLCLLYPFREDFYHRLGFVTAFENRRLRFAPAWLPSYPERVQVRRAVVNDLPAMRRAHGAWCCRTNGSASRNERQFVKLVTDHHAFVVPGVGEGDEVEGYLLWRYVAPQDETQAIEVVELVHLTDRAYRALLGHLVAQRDQVNEIRYDVSVDDPVAALLVRRGAAPAPHLRSLHQDLGSCAAGAMLHVLDWPRALAARGAYGDGALLLHLSDSGERLSLEASGGAVTVAAVPGGEGGDKVGSASGSASGKDVPRLETDARTGARIYVGSLRVSEAVRLGLAKVEGDLAQAERFFALPRPFLLDSF